VAIVKEHDGQLKAPGDRGEDAGAHNEIDGEDAIKLYDELVKRPEDRLALEKEIPSRIAARQSRNGRKTETTRLNSNKGTKSLIGFFATFYS
jgi:hypothetical protein